MSDAVFWVLDGALLGAVVGLALVGIYRAGRRAGAEAERRLWLVAMTQEPSPAVLDRILDEIKAEVAADPRQTARDSATSARSKTFRG